MIHRVHFKLKYGLGKVGTAAVGKNASLIVLFLEGAPRDKVLVVVEE